MQMLNADDRAEGSVEDQQGKTISNIFLDVTITAVTAAANKADKPRKAVR